MRFKQKAAAVSAAGTVLMAFAALQLAPAAAAFPSPVPRPATATAAVPASSKTPMDTGLRYWPGQLLQIKATGTASYGSEGQPGCTGTPVTTPDGDRSVNGVPCSQKFDPNATLPTAPIGSLITSIGVPGRSHSSGWFYAGSHLRMRTSKCRGEIYLLYNDAPGAYGNNAGKYNARLTL